MVRVGTAMHPNAAGAVSVNRPMVHVEPPLATPASASS